MSNEGSSSFGGEVDHDQCGSCYADRAYTPFMPLQDRAAQAVLVLGTASVCWLRSEVEMARIIDAARGAPQWVSAPVLFGPRLPRTRDLLAVAHPGWGSGSNLPDGQSIRRVVDEVDSISHHRQRLPSSEWRGAGDQEIERSIDDLSRRRCDPDRGA